MSAATQKAVIEETLKISSMFRDNCALKHGIAPRQSATTLDGPAVDPPPPPIPISINPTPAPTPADVTATTTSAGTSSPGVGVADTSKGNLTKTAAPLLLAASTALAGATGAYWWMKPAATAVNPIVEKASGDLLQSLQSRGFHLAPGQQWGK